MEVQAGSLITQVIGEMDDNGIALVGLDEWARPGPIDTNDCARDTSRGSLDPVNRPGVLDCRRLGNKSQCGQGDTKSCAEHDGWLDKGASPGDECGAMS